MVGGGVVIVALLAVVAVVGLLEVTARGSGRETRVASEAPVTAMHRSRAPANNSPQIAVHPEGEVLALASRLDKPTFGCALHVSGDDGKTWVPTEPVAELPKGAETCYGPEVAFGPDGTLYYLFVGLSGEGNTPMGVFLTSSTDGGQTFREPTQVLGELNFGVRLAVDRAAGKQGRLHVVWIDADTVGVGSLAPGPNPIMAMSSGDGGASWSEPVRVSDPDRERVVAPAVEVGPQGHVEVAYVDLLDDARDYQGLEGPVWEGQWELVLASSSDGGASFSGGEVVAEVTPHERLMLVFTAPPPALVVGDDGRRCLAWTGAREGSADVWARCRPSAEGAWHEPVRVNDTPPGSETTQELPQLAIADDGRIDAVFYDGRRPPDDDFVDVFHAASTDGGQSFSANMRVSQHTSYREFGPRYGAVASAAGMVEFGSRLGLATLADDTAVAAWADTRNHISLSQGQDVFSATVVGLPAGPDPNTPTGRLVAGLAGAAVLVAVVVGGWVWRRRRTAVGTRAAARGPTS